MDLHDTAFGHIAETEKDILRQRLHKAGVQVLFPDLEP